MAILDTVVDIGITSAQVLLTVLAWLQGLVFTALVLALLSTLIGA